ncbi:MAG TPA: hypothetical protein DCY20_01810 [Firmicutes bacterium]|nr:hypothetical protein [Bacillota bacterium]
MLVACDQNHVSRNKTLDENRMESKANSSNQGSEAVQSETISKETAFVQNSNELEIIVSINDQQFLAKLDDTKTSQALLEQLPLVLDMSELNGNEKYYYLDFNLPTQSQKPKQIQTGDIMLYGDHCLVLFYDSFTTSYSYTNLGSIVESDAFAKAVGTGEVRIMIEQKID